MANREEACKHPKVVALIKACSIGERRPAKLLDQKFALVPVEFGP